ncbi:hypothetical protein GCM10020218_004590 [Dactylosporangium vinaceum]
MCPRNRTGGRPSAERGCYARRTARSTTLKGQLDLELHGGRSIEGVAARVAQRLQAMNAAIWHNRAADNP